MSTTTTSNQRQVISVKDTVSGSPFYLRGNSSDGSLNVNITSGSVTISGVSTATNQTNGSQKTQIVDGAGSVIGSTTNALDVNLKTSSITIGTNIAQINGVTPLMGNGVTGTGSLRVTIASDNTAFAVNSTLSAETTKVIGVVRNADGSGNLLTSTTNALDVNIKSGSIANTSFAATQATASSLNATVVGTGTFAVQNTPVASTTMFNGKTTVTTAGTRVVLAASQAVKSVVIKALSTNTGIIYVGNSTVASTNGLQLLAGETVSLDIANLNTVNIDSSVNGEGVTYIASN